MSLAALNYVSSMIGQTRSLVQGPGGNTSIKIANAIYVKASGTKLAEANSRNIFSKIELSSGKLLSPELRPSIESDLHLSLPFPVVIHVHSVGSLTWALRTLDKENQEFFKSIKISYLSYFRPGQSLAEAIRAIPNIADFRGILLQNHGLVTWGENPIGAFEQLLNLECKLLVESIKIASSKNDNHEITAALSDHIFTPDHAVFSGQESTPSNSSDLLWALEMAISMIPKTAELLTLDESEIDELRNWEAEKFRKNLNS